ncbi:hypothetical protein NPIL_91921 [Nephila pilipes]|uniref:Uncharacterized protein n=1 Tax=Nephila pilipes TaxID=299642 RepID=A0A8X6NBH1_NEPPI|nr:hypothetical protein NPIL_91921 [Nephila pilipes]
MSKKDRFIQHGETLTNIESQINQIDSDMQKSEKIKNKNKDIFDNLKADIYEKRVATLERSHHLKERRVTSIDSSLKFMQSTEQSFSSEIEKKLLAHLSVTD